MMYLGAATTFVIATVCFANAVAWISPRVAFVCGVLFGSVCAPMLMGLLQ